MGGWAAVGAAVRAPERFWAIVMANTVGNLTNPEIAALRQKLAAASPPRPAVLWHGALGATFRKTQPVRTFLYAELAGLNAPRPADFSEQLSRLTTPVEQFAATRVPTMFLTSDEDGLIWPELSKKVHEHVPGSRDRDGAPPRREAGVPAERRRRLPRQQRAGRDGRADRHPQRRDGAGPVRG